MAIKNTRNTRAVPCNWKFPNCGNKTRDNSGYCQIHRTLAARISGDGIRYATSETVIGNRSRHVIAKSARQTAYQKNAELLESYPVITVRQNDAGQWRALVANLTKPEVAARGITIKPTHKDGPHNAVAVTRDDKDEAIFEASAIVAEVWAARINQMAESDPDSVDVYESYVEAVAYARDWDKEIESVEKANKLAPNGRSISFSEDRRSKQLVIKVYHQPKDNPTGFVEYDLVSFQNQLRSVKNNDGSETYIPHMIIDTPRSYHVKVDEQGQPKRVIAKEWSDLTHGIIVKVSKLVAETNKFGIATEDGRIQLPAGWEIRSQNV